MMRPGEVRVVASSSSRAVEGCPFQRGLGYGWGGRTVRSPPAPLARSSAAVPRPSLGYPSAIPRLSLGSLSAISALAMLRVGLHAPVGGEDARAAFKSFSSVRRPIPIFLAAFFYAVRRVVPIFLAAAFSVRITLTRVLFAGFRRPCGRR